MEQVIVITGAGGGLGSVFARELARDGKSIAVLDYDIRAAGQVAAQIRADGGKAAAIRGNVVDKASMEQARQEVREKLGRCNVLINCAGIQDPLAKTTAESYRPGDEMDTVVAKADPDHKETVRELLGKSRTLFNIDAERMMRVMNVNWLGTVIASQVFAAGRAVPSSTSPPWLPMTPLAWFRHMRPAKRQWICLPSGFPITCPMNLARSGSTRWPRGIS